jgi:hypothetical protein
MYLIILSWFYKPGNRGLEQNHPVQTVLQEIIRRKYDHFIWAEFYKWN